MDQCLNGKVVQEIFGSGAVFTEVHTGICPTPAGFSITGQCGQHTVIIYLLGARVDTNQYKQHKNKITKVLALIVHVSSVHVEC